MLWNFKRGKKKIIAEGKAWGAVSAVSHVEDSASMWKRQKIEFFGKQDIVCAGAL